MRALFRLLIIASLAALYGANPSTLGPFYQFLANPAASVQRAETLAQFLMRADAIKNVLRRP